MSDFSCPSLSQSYFSKVVSISRSLLLAPSFLGSCTSIRSFLAPKLWMNPSEMSLESVTKGRGRTESFGPFRVLPGTKTSVLRGSSALISHSFPSAGTQSLKQGCQWNNSTQKNDLEETQDLFLEGAEDKSKE